MRTSSFKKVSLNMVGQSYEGRSHAVSVQKTMNLIPSRELTGAAESSLQSCWGLKSWYSGSGTDRGITVFNGELYKVSDTTLYKIDINATATSLGTIAGSSRCIFDNDGTNLLIATGGNGYQLTGSTLTQITDPDFQNGNSVAYFKTHAVFDGNGGRFQMSSIGDPDSFSSSDIATAESRPDDSKRVGVFRETLYVYGDKTIEPFYYTGNGNPPIARINNAVMNVGLGAIHSVQASNDYSYFLGNDRRVYRFSSTQPENITSKGVSYQIDLMATTSDAIGDILRIEGHTFYILKFPSTNKTFAFNEEDLSWFELSSTASETLYPAQSFVECYGKRLCANNGNVLEVDLDTYTNNGEVIINERIFGPVSSKDLGISGDYALMSRLWLDVETGVGLATGQGVNPQLMVSVSTDGGASYTNERDVLLGRTGEGSVQVKYDLLKSFKQLYIKVRCSDPVFLSLFGAAIEVKAGGI